MASKLTTLTAIYRAQVLQKPGLRCSPQFNDKRFLSDALKKKFEQFQTEDGVPIYLKAGFSDKILFMFTAALSVVGVAAGMYSMLLMAFPKKK